MEFNRLQELPSLEDLLFIGNPLAESFTDEASYRAECIKRLPNLKKLDGETVVSNVGAQPQTQTQAETPAQ